MDDFLAEFEFSQTFIINSEIRYHKSEIYKNPYLRA